MAKKRVIALALSLAMTLSLAACSNTVSNDESENKNSEASVSTEESSVASSEQKEFDPLTITKGVTLKIGVESDDEVIDWETNKATLIIEEKLGVDLVFEEYASGSYLDKLNVMINGGDKLPDIIFSPATSKGVQDMIASWSDAGAILELSDYYANPDYTKYTDLAIEKAGSDFVATLKDMDGNIWGFPRYTPSIGDATAYRLWINTEYAKACGFEELPTTTDGFFELCKAFAAAGDLNGNGRDDEVVFTGREKIDYYWFRYLMTPFADAWDDQYLELTDGKLEFSFTTDGWKDGLKYIKQFFDEGLIDSTIITQDKAAYQAVAYDPEMPILAEFYYYPRMVGKDDVETLKCHNAYDYVCALEGPSGRKEAYYNDPLAIYGALITSDCENPDAAFLVLDFMMSQEMVMRNRFGEEGVNWDYWENIDESKLPGGATKDMYGLADGGEPEFVVYTKEYWGQGNPQNAGYMMAGPLVKYTGVEGSLKGDINSEDEHTRLSALWKEKTGTLSADMMEFMPEERIITLGLTADESADIAETSKVVQSFWKTAAANFVTGEWDIDEYWNTYLSELEKMGINDLLAVYQTAYDRAK